MANTVQEASDNFNSVILRYIFAAPAKKIIETLEMFEVQMLDQVPDLMSGPVPEAVEVVEELERAYQQVYRIASDREPEDVR